MSVTPLALRHPGGPAWPLGRTFLHPAFDLAFIGGGLSLIVVVMAYAGGLRFTMANLSLVLVHAVSFYGACVVLAYVLFVLWPDSYEWAGFDPALTTQLTVAVINIHHFIVDAYIWRLRKDPNYRTVVDTSSATRTPA